MNIGGRLFKKYKRKTFIDNVEGNDWKPIIRNQTSDLNRNASYYGPYQYVRLKSHQSPLHPNLVSSQAPARFQKFSATNRRESREIYNTPDLDSNYLRTPTQSLPSAKPIDYFSNSFHEGDNTSINQEWSPITHWTLLEYDPHSFSYHYHNIKYPNRKL